MPQYFGQLHTTKPSWSTIGAIQAIQQDDRQVRFNCGEPGITISVLAPNLVRVRMSPTGTFLPRRSWAVTRADEQWSPVPFEVRETAEAIEIETEQLRIVVQRDPCRISALTQPDNPLPKMLTQ
jgi:alpha-glucosidase